MTPQRGQTFKPSIGCHIVGLARVANGSGDRRIEHEVGERQMLRLSVQVPCPHELGTHYAGNAVTIKLGE